ncbi:helix-turn-helix transcriptional regulator [Brevibacillus laterosporus]|uniref:helix-turn-helix transcriptional regulator n=1 Tax=Brevibacillus laterosporus TaxID=1465 RepID=UPI003D21C960
MKKSSRERNFLIKQRAYLKVYLITKIKKGRSYGLQLAKELGDEFIRDGFVPTSAEVYRSLDELVEQGIVSRHTQLQEGTEKKPIIVYKINDLHIADSYLQLVQQDLQRSQRLIEKALKDNFHK